MNPVKMINQKLDLNYRNLLTKYELTTIQIQVGYQAYIKCGNDDYARLKRNSQTQDCKTDQHHNDNTDPTKHTTIAYQYDRQNPNLQAHIIEVPDRVVNALCKVQHIPFVGL